MDGFFGSPDCVHCKKVKSGNIEMKEGWLCDACAEKIHYGISGFKQYNVSGKLAEYNRLLTNDEIEKCFAELENNVDLVKQCKATKQSEKGNILIDEEKGVIYVARDVRIPIKGEYVPPAHKITDITDYYIMYRSQMISRTDNAIKTAYVVIEFADSALRYELIPLGNPKGFFNFQRRLYYKKASQSEMRFLQEIIGRPPKKPITVVYKSI